MATPKRLDKQAEIKLVRAIEDATALTSGGTSPSAAIAKAAADHSVPPGHLQLMINAYNTGMTNHHRQLSSSDDPLDKAASFPLANVEEVRGILYPTVKTAAVHEATEGVSAEYSQQPSWLSELQRTEKAARTVPFVKTANVPPLRDTSRLITRAFNLTRDAEREADELRRQASAARDKVAACLSSLDEYFRLPAALPFNTVRYAAKLAFGQQAEMVLDKVAKSNQCLLKTAERRHVPFDPVSQPYSLVRGCLDAAHEYAAAANRHQTFKATIDLKTEKLGRALLPPGNRNPIIYGSALSALTREKRAAEEKPKGEGLFGYLGKVVGGTLTADAVRRLGGMVPTKETNQEGENDALESVTDPLHQQKLDSIRRQAMLHDFMANDPIISSYHPDEVTQVYNELSQLSPRTAGQPMMMRALLRRHLSQGQLDTHDLDQLSGVETKLKQRDQPMQSPKTIDLSGLKKEPASA